MANLQLCGKKETKRNAPPARSQNFKTKENEEEEEKENGQRFKALLTAPLKNISHQSIIILYADVKTMKNKIKTLKT